MSEQLVSDSFCEWFLEQIAGILKECPRCKAFIPQEDAKCYQCGARQAPAEIQDSEVGGAA